MSAQSDYVFHRANRWIFNHGRQAAPFYIVVMIVTLLLLAFAEPPVAIVAAVVGLAIVGWRDIDVVSRGSPEALFFRTFDVESLEQTCKYYGRVMAQKGIPDVVYELDNSILRFFYHQGDMTWTYYMVVMMQRKATMQISMNAKEENDSESLQQTELPPVPASEGTAGSEGDSTRNPDAGN